MTYRDYDPDKDFPAVRRIWKEVGWIKDEETDGTYLDGFFRAANDALVATIDGDAECAVHSTHGEILYLDEPLSLGGVTAVTTSRISRKLGFARELTAQLLARQADAGMEISALGMFEQGFYNKLGFGTGAYENRIRFDPATLTVDDDFRPPRRLRQRDYEQVHTALCNRTRGHGGVTLSMPEMLRLEMGLTPEPFGLGYFDGPGGTLSHFIWGVANGEHGPYVIKFSAWQSSEQLLELLALIKSLGDQVNQVSMLENNQIQLQDLLKQPIRHRRSTRGGEFVNESRSVAFWQIRMLDIEACLAKTHLNTPTLRFNLELTDPVTDFLVSGSNWRGLSGDYVIQLGAQSSAETGTDKSLPTLRAGVGAFSRLWFGIRPASSLSITDNLQGDAALIEDLDATLRLPKPHPGWEF
jgi:predicted acetyltransferase